MHRRPGRVTIRSEAGSTKNATIPIAKEMKMRGRP
jgi:hypothetical protein